MESTIQSQQNTGTFRGWMIVVVLAVLFIIWGLFIFYTVGDKGPPSCNFGVIRDVPGESPYSTEKPREGSRVQGAK